MTRHVPLAGVLLLCLLAGRALAEEQGSLSGQLVLAAGKLPEPKLIPVPLGKAMPDESLLVDRESRGIANILISLHVLPGGIGPPATVASPLPARLLLRENRFVPRMLVAQAGQTLLIENLDPDHRHVKGDTFTNAPFNLLLERDVTREVELKKSEKLPVSLSSSINPAMRGYLVVLDHPYFAVTDDQGRFAITGLPPGEWTFRAWHERSGYVEKVALDSGPTVWAKGQFKCKIAAGKNDLGVIEVALEEMPDK